MRTETKCRETPCCPNTGERPRYYARQLITSDDLTLEQEYFRSKLRLHNRLLHGWGVVCGALVCLVPKKKGDGYEPWQVMVKPGFALDPCGNEINIDCTRTLDVRTRGVTGVTGEPCVEATDPWCSEIFEDRPDDKLYVAVRYKQFATRPVRVQPQGCGCDDTRCENSRWRDGYEIGIVNHCPDSHTKPPEIGSLIRGHVPKCPDCPDDSWVILARITVDAAGAVDIDNCECRRLVASTKDFWWACEGELRCTKFKEYAFGLGGASDAEKQTILKAFANELIKTRGEAAILIYRDNPAVKVDSEVNKRAVDFLVSQGIDSRRITVNSDGIGKPRIELWVCPEGAPKPVAVVEPGIQPPPPQTDSKEAAISEEESHGESELPKKGRRKDLRGKT